MPCCICTRMLHLSHWLTHNAITASLAQLPQRLLAHKPCYASIQHVAVLVMQILWAFCVYVEAVSVLPQLRMMQKAKVVERFTAHYVFALGLSRFLSCAHWVLQVSFMCVFGRKDTSAIYSVCESLAVVGLQACSWLCMQGPLVAI